MQRCVSERLGYNVRSNSHEKARRPFKPTPRSAYCMHFTTPSSRPSTRAPHTRRHGYLHPERCVRFKAAKAPRTPRHSHRTGSRGLRNEHGIRERMPCALTEVVLNEPHLLSVTKPCLTVSPSPRSLAAKTSRLPTPDIPPVSFMSRRNHCRLHLQEELDSFLTRTQTMRPDGPCIVVEAGGICVHRVEHRHHRTPRDPRVS